MRIFRVCFLLLPALTGLSTETAPGADDHGALLIVLNKSDAQAALVDPATYEVIARLPTGDGPHEVAASADGSYAYISNYGTSRALQARQKPQEPAGNTLTIVDLRKRSVTATWRLGAFRAPHGIWVSRNGRYVWVTCEASKAVLELDADTGKVARVWKTNQERSHMLVPSLDEKKLYVANTGSGSVSVIDRTRPADDAPAPPISSGAGSEGIALSPDGREVWVASRQANTISVIDTSTDKVAATFPSGGAVPIRVKFTPDGKQAWVSNAQSNSVSIFDAAARTLIATMDVGSAPVGIVITPDGKRAFIAATNANQVVVVDTATRQVIQRFKTGNEPDGMAWVNAR